MSSDAAITPDADRRPLRRRPRAVGQVEAPDAVEASAEHTYEPGEPLTWEEWFDQNL